MQKKHFNKPTTFLSGEKKLRHSSCAAHMVLIGDNNVVCTLENKVENDKITTKKVTISP